jgi:hypothetical protein
MLLFFRLLSKIKLYKTAILPFLLCGCQLGLPPLGQIQGVQEQITDENILT